MRNIKLKIWNNEELVDVKSIDFDDVGNLYRVNNELVNPSEVELIQDTGIKDKNEVEIYEGDILFNKSTICQPDGKLTTKIIGDIQILNGMTYLIGKTWQDVDGEDIRLSEYKSLMLNPEMFKIIGNVYENPEIRDNY